MEVTIAKPSTIDTAINNTLLSLLENDPENQQPTMQNTQNNQPTESPRYTPTTAPFPMKEIKSIIKECLRVILVAEDLPSYIDLDKISEFHFVAGAVKVETALMRAGAYVDFDGRLKGNKENKEKKGE